MHFATPGPTVLRDYLANRAMIHRNNAQNISTRTTNSHISASAQARNIQHQA